MQTLDLLGTVERRMGRYESARAWYVAAQELARGLGDDRQLAGGALNIGGLLHQQAMALSDNAQERGCLLRDAATSVSTSLALFRKHGHEIDAVSSIGELGLIYKDLGEFDEAERFTREALTFYEPLDHPYAYKAYWNLEDIAVARNDPEEAAAWRAKKEAKLAQLQRLAQGDGPPRLPPQARDAFLALCRALHTALAAHRPIPLDAANTITQLATQPDPLGTAGRFLHQIADGEHPDPPAGLPAELTEIFAALVRGLRALPRHGADDPV
jgi:tetratricopeptide (TPR) repeat protein